MHLLEHKLVSSQTKVTKFAGGERVKASLQTLTGCYILLLAGRITIPMNSLLKTIKKQINWVLFNVWFWSLEFQYEYLTTDWANHLVH